MAAMLVRASGDNNRGIPSFLRIIAIFRTNSRWYATDSSIIIPLFYFNNGLC